MLQAVRRSPPKHTPTQTITTTTTTSYCVTSGNKSLILLILNFLFNLSAPSLSCSIWDQVHLPGIQPRALGPPGKSKSLILENQVFYCAVIFQTVWDSLCGNPVKRKSGAAPPFIILTSLSVTYTSLAITRMTLPYSCANFLGV